MPLSPDFCTTSQWTSFTYIMSRLWNFAHAYIITVWRGMIFLLGMWHRRTKFCTPHSASIMNRHTWHACINTTCTYTSVIYHLSNLCVYMSLSQRFILMSHVMWLWYPMCNHWRSLDTHIQIFRLPGTSKNFQAPILSESSKYLVMARPSGVQNMLRTVSNHLALS